MAENKEKEAVKFVVYQFNENEMLDLNDASKIIKLTGNKYIELNKKDLKNGNIYVVFAVSRNNNMSTSVTLRR